MSSQISDLYAPKRSHAGRFSALTSPAVGAGIVAIGTLAAWLLNRSHEQRLTDQTRDRLVPSELVQEVPVIVPNASDIHIG